MKLVLASNSPRRKSLLKQIGIHFLVHVPDLDEHFPKEKFSEPKKLVMHLAVQKVKAAQPHYPDDLILAADTLVCKGKTILGKPRTKQEALKMLALLNGKQHRVVTGVALAYHGKIHNTFSETRVWFQKHTHAFLKKYVETGEPLDKAGAYGIQGAGALLVKKIDGDYFNVVGLPLVKVWELLSKAQPKGNSFPKWKFVPDELV